VEGESEQLRNELARALLSERVHGAYLFEGPPGTAARETAIWFARLLLCRQPGSEPCERCHSCGLSRWTDEGPQHPDLHWIAASGGLLRIDAVRGLQRQLGLTAHQGGRRVGLLLEADQLNLAAANALLKTLEEPAQGVVLILAARSAAPLPPTVCSRLTRVRFSPQSEDTVRRALQSAGMSAEDAALAAALGGGSVAAARAWSEAQLEAARGYWSRLAALGEQPLSAVLDLAEGFRGSGAREQVLLLLDVHAAWARARLRAAVAAADAGATERWLGRLEAGQRTRRELERRNLNPQLAVEALLLR
jgi:DNA polymerase-3 subunit delta'